MSSPKQELAVSPKHSTLFNNQVANALKRYDDIKSALVDADTMAAKNAAKKFGTLIDSIKFDELNKDARVADTLKKAVTELKANAEAMVEENDLTEIRQDFRMISENLFPFLRSIQYEGPKLYWQNCPMAFGEGKDANWISNTKEIFNPYLGKHHPEYKGTMLHCGIVNDSIQ